MVSNNGHAVLVQDSVAVLGQRSASACSVASYQGAVHLAWTGADSHVNVMWSNDGYHFGGQQVLPYQSRTLSTGDQTGRMSERVLLPPSLAGGPAGLLLAWTDADAVNVAWPGQAAAPSGLGYQPRLGIGIRPPAGHTGLSARPTSAPAVAPLGHEAVLAWTGAIRGPLSVAGSVNVSRSGGRVFGQPTDVGRSASAPSVCALGSELALAWVHKGQLHVRISHGGEFGQPITCPGVRDRVAICSLGGELVVAWLQRGRWGTLPRGLNVGFLRAGQLVPAIQLDAVAMPQLVPWSMCEHAGAVMLAWPDRDKAGRITVCRLRLAGAPRGSGSGW